MNSQQFEQHKDKFIGEMKALMDTKNPDYSMNDDCMNNYKWIADNTGLTPVQAWGVLMLKHISAIVTYIKKGGLMDEPIHGRLLDLANYALLGDGLIEDMRQSNSMDTEINTRRTMSGDGTLAALARAASHS
jgi:hypothetical protein